MKDNRIVSPKLGDKLEGFSKFLGEYIVARTIFTFIFNWAGRIFIIWFLWHFILRFLFTTN